MREGTTRMYYLCKKNCELISSRKYRRNRENIKETRDNEKQTDTPISENENSLFRRIRNKLNYQITQFMPHHLSSRLTASY